jgi:hypothetical protein
MTIANILTIIGLVITVFGSIITVWVLLVSRITTLEVQLREHKEQSDRDNKRYENFETEIKKDISKLYDKIDEIKDLIIKNINK